MACRRVRLVLVPGYALVNAPENFDNSRVCVKDEQHGQNVENRENGHVKYVLILDVPAWIATKLVR